jgi:DHA1 family bicyclomycin/chloramphenicol resistance-like MFS transporter
MDIAVNIPFPAGPVTGPPKAPTMTSSFYRTAVVLGLLSAIGPFAIDMYLPALPAIGADLSAGIGAVQMSLMAFFAALATAQIVYGPISDMVGRKLPIYFGLVLFAAASIGCALAPNVETLILFRFLQGLGAAAPLVIPRAIVRDLHTGADATRLMSLLMLVFSVSPILAPLGGSLIIAAADWRGIFLAVTVAGVLGLLLTFFLLPETRPAAARRESSLRSALAGYGVLLRDRRFLGLTFIGGFGMASFFTYLANSSFLLIDHFGLSPMLYSVFFSINAVAFIGAAQFNGMLASRFGLERLVRSGVLGSAVVMFTLLVITIAGVDRLDVLAVLLFVGYGFLGLVVPTTAVLALEDHGAIAGTASALMGTLQLATGALAILAIGFIVDGTVLPMVEGITLCIVVSLLLTELTLGRRRSRRAMEISPAE